jgi:hypothetical protein
MAKIKINDNSSTDDVVSPTQNQMDLWVEAELAEATEDQMLVDETPTTLFSESINESID